MIVNDRDRIFAGLASLLEGDGEYVSHLTALYLLGQWHELPEVLTIVSPRRRRPRTLEGRPLVFILLPVERLKPVQTVSLPTCTLTVSTQEKTLIDLVSYLDHAPPFGALINLFATMPFSPTLLLHMAQHASDSVLKRISWLLGFTGQAAAPDLPWESMTRTPVKLDSRIVPEETLWDGRFYLRFPEFLLSIPLPEPSLDSPVEVYEWIELRRFPAFLEEWKTAGEILLRGDPSERAKKRLEIFLCMLFETVVKQNLDSFLITHIEGIHYEKRGAGLVPLILNRWFDRNPERFEQIRLVIEKWVRNHLHSSTPEKMETALYFGHRLGLDKEVLDALGCGGYSLLNAGRERVIARLASDYLAGGIPLPCLVYVVASRAAARRGNFEEALTIVESGRSMIDGRGASPTEMGELAYAAGNVLRIMNRIEQALPELFLARECFMTAGDSRGLILVDTAMGSLYFSRGMMREARTWYLQALSVARATRNNDSQGSLLGNLGMIDYDFCRFRRAILHFTRSIALQKARRNDWSVSVILMARAKANLQMGYLTKAAKDFQEAHALKTRLRHQAGIDESGIMLAWVSDLIGRSAAAKSWWTSVPDDRPGSEPRVRFLIKNIHAMAALFGGDPAGALEQFRETLAFVRVNAISAAGEGSVLHGIGVCLAYMRKPGAAETLLEARDAIGKDSGRFQVRLINVFGALYFPEAFSEVNLQKELEAWLDGQAFDPFWGWYAHALRDRSEPAAEAFLEHHLRRTPTAMLKLLQERVPTFGGVLARMEQHQARAAEFLTHLIAGEPHPMHVNDYQLWHDSAHRGIVIFDGPGGYVAYGDRRAEIKPGSLAYGILTNLVSAYPRSVDVEVLFRAAWGTAFDPECDPAALKSAIGRVRRILRSVHPGIGLRRRTVRIAGNKSSTGGSIRLVLPPVWEAILL
ncbi:MAG: tetratricopeptide repeat protein [Candidatus Ozemobacteraceae bacterium]